MTTLSAISVDEDDSLGRVGDGLLGAYGAAFVRRMMAGLDSEDSTGDAEGDKEDDRYGTHSPPSGPHYDQGSGELSVDDVSIHEHDQHHQNDPEEADDEFSRFLEPLPEVPLQQSSLGGEDVNTGIDDPLTITQVMAPPPVAAAQTLPTPTSAGKGGAHVKQNVSLDASESMITMAVSESTISLPSVSFRLDEDAAQASPLFAHPPPQGGPSPAVIGTKWVRFSSTGEDEYNLPDTALVDYSTDISVDAGSMEPESDPTLSQEEDFSQGGVDSRGNFCGGNDEISADSDEERMSAMYLEQLAITNTSSFQDPPTLSSFSLSGLRSSGGKAGSKDDANSLPRIVASPAMLVEATGAEVKPMPNQTLSLPQSSALGTSTALASTVPAVLDAASTNDDDGTVLALVSSFERTNVNDTPVVVNGPVTHPPVEHVAPAVATRAVEEDTIDVAITVKVPPAEPATFEGDDQMRFSLRRAASYDAFPSSRILEASENAAQPVAAGIDGLIGTRPIQASSEVSLVTFADEQSTRETDLMDILRVSSHALQGDNSLATREEGDAGDDAETAKEMIRAAKIMHMQNRSIARSRSRDTYYARHPDDHGASEASVGGTGSAADGTKGTIGISKDQKAQLPAVRQGNGQHNKKLDDLNPRRLSWRRRSVSHDVFPSSRFLDIEASASNVPSNITPPIRIKRSSDRVLVPTGVGVHPRANGSSGQGVETFGVSLVSFADEQTARETDLTEVLKIESDRTHGDGGAAIGGSSDDMKLSSARESIAAAKGIHAESRRLVRSRSRDMFSRTTEDSVGHTSGEPTDSPPPLPRPSPSPAHDLIGNSDVHLDEDVALPPAFFVASEPAGDVGNVDGGDRGYDGTSGLPGGSQFVRGVSSMSSFSLSTGTAVSPPQRHFAASSGQQGDDSTPLDDVVVHEDAEENNEPEIIDSERIDGTETPQVDLDSYGRKDHYMADSRLPAYARPTFLSRQMSGSYKSGKPRSRGDSGNRGSRRSAMDRRPVPRRRPQPQPSSAALKPRNLSHHRTTDRAAGAHSGRFDRAPRAASERSFRAEQAAIRRIQRGRIGGSLGSLQSVQSNDIDEITRPGHAPPALMAADPQVLSSILKTKVKKKERAKSDHVPTETSVLPPLETSSKHDDATLAVSTELEVGRGTENNGALLIHNRNGGDDVILRSVDDEQVVRNILSCNTDDIVSRDNDMILEVDLVDDERDAETDKDEGLGEHRDADAHVVEEPKTWSPSEQNGDVLFHDAPSTLLGAPTRNLEELSSAMGMTYAEQEEVWQLVDRKDQELDAAHSRIRVLETRVATLLEERQRMELLRREMHNTIQELKGTIRVHVRVRPPHGAAAGETAEEVRFRVPPGATAEGKQVVELSLHGTRRNRGGDAPGTFHMQRAGSRSSMRSLAGRTATGVSLRSLKTSGRSLRQKRTAGAAEAAGSGGVAAGSFSFDRVFGPQATQGDVFEEVAQLVQSVIDGHNVCLFAFGQTGSGKTHTMMTGDDGGGGAAADVAIGISSPHDGVTPRSVRQIFEAGRQLAREGGWKFGATCSLFELYNDTVRDLLIPGNGDEDRMTSRTPPLSTAEARSRARIMGTCIREVPVSACAETLALLERGRRRRASAETALNDRSSRSHLVFQLTIERSRADGEEARGTLTLVDLAGSERVAESHATGQRLKEACHINKSLFALADVLSALANGDAFVPYRNSKLTQLLQPSLQRSPKVLMLCCVSPEARSLHETLNTLRFAEQVNSVALPAVGAQQRRRQLQHRENMNKQNVDLASALK